MQEIAEKTFDDLVVQYLGKKLPDELAASVSMSKLSDEAKGFTLRMLSIMKRSEYSVTEFNPHLIHWLSVTVPSSLPGAWGGRIPPLTLPGRHKKLDNYVANLALRSGEQPLLYLDVGCGFPPVTTADTANKLQNWHVYGIDHLFADYVLYDIDGHYACFDHEGMFLYFQGLMNDSGRALYADPKATRNRFNVIFEDLHSLLKKSNGTESETVERDGKKLIHHHIRDFETNNLTFITTDFSELKLQPIKVIRCMNVLIYYEPVIREKLLRQAAELLDKDGILIAGTNGLGIQTRYAVYKKNLDGLKLDEFDFGLDNVGHLVYMPFFSIHENDPEAMLLAELTGALRSNQSFWPDFSNRQDDLLKHFGFCQRRPDGFLDFKNDGMPLGEYFKNNALLWQKMQEEGYTDRAVNALVQSGYDAWKNSVGDIAIRPKKGLVANP